METTEMHFPRAFRPVLAGLIAARAVACARRASDETTCAGGPGCIADIGGRQPADPDPFSKPNPFREPLACPVIAAGRRANPGHAAARRRADRRSFRRADHAGGEEGRDRQG